MPEPEAKPKNYSTEPEPGGRLPDVGQLFTETMNEFMDNIGPYVLAGLGLTVVVVPITFLTIFVAYAVIFGGIFGISIVGAIAAVAAAEVSEGLAGFVMLVFQILALVVPFGGFFLLIAGMMALLAPLNASLARAVAEQQRGGKKLDFSSTFSSITRDLVKVISVAGMMGLMTTLGALACYVPALGVLFLFGFAISMVALHRMAPVTALKANLAHAMAHLQWHVLFGALYLVVFMVGSYVPVVGSMFVVAFHVRAYRTIFGDGDEPELVVA